MGKIRQLPGLEICLLWNMVYSIVSYFPICFKVRITEIIVSRIMYGPCDTIFSFLIHWITHVTLSRKNFDICIRDPIYRVTLRLLCRPPNFLNLNFWNSLWIPLCLSQLCTVQILSIFYDSFPLENFLTVFGKANLWKLTYIHYPSSEIFKSKEKCMMNKHFDANHGWSLNIHLHSIDSLFITTVVMLFPFGNLA
jgi:hypothetical protein